MRYKFFEFKTGHYAAGEEGFCRGDVNVETGDIHTVTTYGLSSYREEKFLHISDKVHTFPYSEEDDIILAARKALETA